jgi:hypothetical protein
MDTRTKQQRAMRVCYFTIPYLLSVLILTAKNLIPETAPSSAHKSRSWLIGRFILKQSHSFPSFLIKLGFPLRISMCDFLGVANFLFINISALSARIRRSLPRGAKNLDFLEDESDAGSEPIDPLSWPATEVWAMTLGILTILNLGWYSLMPITRRSVLLEAVGLPWELTLSFSWLFTASCTLLSGYMLTATTCTTPTAS